MKIPTNFDAYAAGKRRKIEKKQKDNLKISFEISHQERKELYWAWKHCARKNFPINVFLQWQFDYDVKKPYDNIEVIRTISHNVLMFCRREGKIPSHVLRTRHNPVGSNVEVCNLACHIPEPLYPKFEKMAKTWGGYGIDVSKCSYDPELNVGSLNLITVFDYMTRATSRETQSLMPGIYTENSGMLWKPICFASEKLDRDKIKREEQLLDIVDDIPSFEGVLR